MKKRILSILLALCLCIGLLPTAALADTGNTPTELTKVVLGTNYKETSVGTTKYILPSGTYKLTEDIELDYYIRIGDSSSPNADVVLDLNGHILKYNNTKNYSMLSISNGSQLALTDSSENKGGKVRALAGRAIQIQGKNTLRANGGSVYGEMRFTGSEAKLQCDAGAARATSFYGSVTTTINNAVISGGIFYGSIDNRIQLAGKTVTFMNGKNTYAQQVVSSGSAPQRPANPSKEGCTFGGWYEKDTDGKLKANAFDFNTVIIESTTLYAK